MSKPMVQVKFTIEHDIVSAFKARCASQGVSMASVISQFMKTSQPAKPTKPKIDSRPQRKKALMEYIRLLEELMYMEVQYRDAIPEHFTTRFEAADYSCSQLSEAISGLGDAYP